jgi:hypothetical protein
MSRDDHIYAAGLIDGEGTITLSRSGSRDLYRHPVVSVPSTTPALVEAMKTLFGGSISKKRPSKLGHTLSQSWKVRFDAAIVCLERVTPYLREPEKIRRARLILDEFKQLTIRNGKYTKAQRIAKLDFEKRFFQDGIKPSRGRLRF